MPNPGENRDRPADRRAPLASAASSRMRGAGALPSRRRADALKGTTSKQVPFWLKLLIASFMPIVVTLILVIMLATGQATFNTSQFLTGLPAVLFSVATIFVAFELFKLRFGPGGKALTPNQKLMVWLLPFVSLVCTVLVAIPGDVKDRVYGAFMGYREASEAAESGAGGDDGGNDDDDEGGSYVPGQDDGGSYVPGQD